MTTAVILAAGRGSRMGTDVPKQFLLLDGEPLVARTIRAFEESPAVDRILLVSGPEYTDYCRDEICSRFGFRKVEAVLKGGRERYESVLKALVYLEEKLGVVGEEGQEKRLSKEYVLIHDGARPFVTQEIILRLVDAAKAYGAAAAGMPSKDTVKITDEEGYAVSTPPRDHVWIMQTPQAFSLDILLAANRKLLAEGCLEDVTDDAMIVERSGLARVRLVEGSYDNIKITTPDDLRFLKDTRDREEAAFPEAENEKNM